jgi:hypothetical protein
MVGMFAGPVGLETVLVLEIVLVAGTVVDVDVAEAELEGMEDVELVGDELEGTEDVEVIEDELEETDTVDKDEEEMLVDVEDEAAELEEAAAGIESSPGVYFVRS